jgi:hypothetical protein
MYNAETYSNAAPQGAGEWLKAIFMPSSNLDRVGAGQKEKEAKQQELIANAQKESQQAEIDAKKRKKMVGLGIGVILVGGLAVGLYYAFKK